MGIEEEVIALKLDNMLAKYSDSQSRNDDGEWDGGGGGGSGKPKQGSRGRKKPSEEKKGTKTTAKKPAKSLIPKSQRGSHPRAQVQSLKRIATRALNTADRITEFAYGDALSADQKDEQKALRAKAKAALAEMQAMNREHKLGY
jgi:hypothetical protein